MRLLYFAILCALWAVTSHAAVTSRLPRARTPGPREVSLEVLREDRREKPTRHKRATPANDTFSYTTALSNDNNGYALVHYSGAYSSKIFIVTQKSQNYRVIQSNLWRTTDYGRVYSNDTHKLPADAIVNHFYISLNKDKLILADQKNNRLYRTVNGGDSYMTTDVGFDPSTLEFHPNIEKAVLAYDEDHKELYISTDFGENWQKIDSDVYAYSWDPSTSVPTVYYETDVSNGTFLWSGMVSEGKLSKGEFDSNLGAVERNSLVLINDYIFVEKQLNLSDTSGEGGLFVSYQRNSFKETMFPFKTQEQHYLIADASQGQALIAVYHFGNLTNLYLSDETGQLYSLSIQNLKGSGISSWRSRSASVQLVKIEGITGTYIANRLDPIATSSYYYWPTFTQITYDKGGTWRFIRRPAYGADGRPNGNCTLSEDCNLNLRIDQPSRQGVYSNTHALGLIAAHGNSGKYLNTYWWAQYYSNVYLSRDAGFTWTEEFNSGAYEYSFLDHGGVVVSVSRYSGYSVYTKSITYSCTEGLSWQQRDISDSNLYVIGMLTEPGSTTLEATVFAKTPGTFKEWLLVQMNFSVLINRTCQQQDYIKWVPSDERQGGQCLLGERAVYERRKPEVCCFNGRSYERPINTSTCPCKLQDFDCEVGYEKLSTDSPCTPAEGTVPEGAPLVCPEGSSYTRTLGYRLIPGDKCEGGDSHAYAPREYPCPIRAPTSLVLSPNLHYYRIGQRVEIRLSQGFGSRTSTMYRWSYGDGHTEELQGYFSSETVSHSYTAAGLYTVELSASNSGGVNNVSVLITVLDVVSSFQLTGVITPVPVGTTARYSLSVFSPAPDRHLLPAGTYGVTWSVRLGAGDVVSVEGSDFSYLLVSEGLYFINVEVYNNVTARPVQESRIITVVGIPASLSLSPSTDPSFLRSGHAIRLTFHQGTETDYTRYSVDFGDSSRLAGLNYSATENLEHAYSQPGMYSVVVWAMNIAGNKSVAREITIYDEIASAVIKYPTILIVGLNEVFNAEYTTKYHSTSFSGTIRYSWEIGDSPADSFLSSSITQTFHNASSVTIHLTVSNEVSAVSTSQVVTVHPSAQDIRLKQDGQSYKIQSMVSLSLVARDFAELPKEGVTYHWDVGEGPELTSAGPSITFQYTTMGTKVVKVYSLSNSDGTTINHVVSGTVHLFAAISAATSEHNTGTTEQSSSVNLTLTDAQNSPYVGPVTVLLSDNTHNDWAYNNHMFYVSDGSLELTLSPLPKYTVYKITIGLSNPVSKVSAVLEIARVREAAHSVFVTLEWVRTPPDTNTSQWEQKVEESVANQIQDQFHFQPWRLSVELTIQQDQPYSVHIKLLPNNNTDVGNQDLMASLSDISEYFQAQKSIAIKGTDVQIPVSSVEISDGTSNTVHVYTLVGLSVGVPIILVLFIGLTIPFIVCAAVYIRKYRKVSHAYSRLRQSRANNFMFTHDGMEDEDDEPPVSLEGSSKAGSQVKFSLDDNFDNSGFGNNSAKPDI